MVSLRETVSDNYHEGGPASAIYATMRYGLGWASYKCRDINKKIHQRTRGADGVDVTAESWDNLIILDACRYDAFAECIDLDGTLESRISKGSQSLEFLEANFDSGPYNDTIYISGNPYTDEIDTDFFKLLNVWDAGWDPDYQTVLPETITQAAISAHNEHPDKRLIIHYMQPHMPFIGEQGMECRRKYNLNNPDSDDSLSVGPALHYGLSNISVDEAWNGYVENLSLVLESVTQLLEEIDGISVITADHGELFGEWVGPLPAPVYGHTPQIRAEPLVKVPWFIVDGGSERHIKADVSEQTETPESDTAKNRLKDLGYI
jgi:hypothetical protein